VFVTVKDGNIEQALKALKQKLSRQGVFKEMKLRRYHEKPSEQRRRRREEAIRRQRRTHRKRAVASGEMPQPIRRKSPKPDPALLSTADHYRHFVSRSYFR
jgi:small subunit ribosomal protein S21